MTLSDIFGAFAVWRYKMWACAIGLGGGLFLVCLVVGGADDCLKVLAGVLAGAFAGVLLERLRGTRPGKMSEPKEPTP
jgi:hypothetical protein